MKKDQVDKTIAITTIVMICIATFSVGMIVGQLLPNAKQQEDSYVAGVKYGTIDGCLQLLQFIYQHKILSDNKISELFQFCDPQPVI